MNPKVSVIIPAYNTAKYVRQAIQSVLDQTEQDIEAIVIDDGSIDSTADIIKNFSDARIKLFANDRNRGLRYSLNRGLKEAKGEWIALLDSDDWYASPKRIEKLLQAAQLHNGDVVADDIYFIQDGEERPYATLLSTGEQFNEPKPIDAVTFLESNIKPAGQSPHYGLLKPLFKRSFLSQHGLEYDESLWHTGDLHFYMICLIAGARFIIVPEPYYFYRRAREGSSAGGKKLDRLEQLHMLCLLLLNQESTRKNSELVQSLYKSISVVEKEINYYRIVQPIKEKGFLAAFPAMLRDPDSLSMLMNQIPELLKRRFYYHMGR